MLRLDPRGPTRPLRSRNLDEPIRCQACLDSDARTRFDSQVGLRTIEGQVEAGESRLLAASAKIPLDRDEAKFRSHT